MNKYNFIVNPITNRKISIYNNLGKEIIKKYLYIFSGGNLKTSTRLDSPRRNKMNLKTATRLDYDSGDSHSGESHLDYDSVDSHLEEEEYEEKSNSKMSLKAPSIKLRQISIPIRTQDCSNCFAHASSTTIRGIITWIKRNCLSKSVTWSSEVKKNTPLHRDLVKKFTKIFYGEDSVEDIKTRDIPLGTIVMAKWKYNEPYMKGKIIKQHKLKNDDKYDVLFEKDTPKKIIKYISSKYIKIVDNEKCQKISLVRSFLNKSSNDIFKYIKDTYDFDTRLTQNKDIVMREIGKNKGSGVIICVFLLKKEHERFSIFIENIKNNRIPKNSILKREDISVTDTVPGILGRMSAPLYNYQDRLSDYKSGKTYEHAMTINGFNLEHTTPYWTIKNSHGSDFGDSGNIRIALDAFDDCVGISFGYIDKLGMLGRNLQRFLDPWERCNVSYVIIKPSDSILTSCTAQSLKDRRGKIIKFMDTDSERSPIFNDELEEEMLQLGLKMESNKDTIEDLHRYNELKKLQSDENRDENWLTEEQIEKAINVFVHNSGKKIGSKGFKSIVPGCKIVDGRCELLPHVIESIYWDIEDI